MTLPHPKREIGKLLHEFLEKCGIDTLYFLPIASLLVYFFLYHKDLKKWKTLSSHERFQYITTVIMTILFIFVGIIHYIRTH